jgi:hypothetical protein
MPQPLTKRVNTVLYDDILLVSCRDPQSSKPTAEAVAKADSELRALEPLFEACPARSALSNATNPGYLHTTPLSLVWWYGT